LTPPLSTPSLPRPRPERLAIDGRYARLEPLDPLRHVPGLYEASSGAGAAARFAYLFEEPPADVATLAAWAQRACGPDDPLFFAVVDRSSGVACGRQALMRIVPEHGVIEIGSILWGPAMARTRLATEALYLAARHVFEDLRYRRFEWKCNNLNEPSKRAAVRFGFRHEGVFRQHMWAKGANRDTAWFAMLDADWLQLAPGYERWLAPGNFDAEGRERQSLRACLAQPA
jgi:RimJ/RimL family protein N-acetyltransferase